VNRETVVRADKRSWEGHPPFGIDGGIMAAVCQVTGAVPGFGHNISHSHRRTKRRFDPNIQKKTYYVPSLRRNVTLNVSAKGIKVIDARGIESVVKDILARGEKI
jgi:large subunit ribosomal protein L28